MTDHDYLAYNECVYLVKVIILDILILFIMLDTN